MTDELLPDQFSDLNHLVAEWALPSESLRNAKRITSTIEQHQNFYDALFPRMEEIVIYLNQYPLDQMPDEAKRLLYLALSLMESALPVEVLGQPNMPDAVEDSRLEYLHER